MFEAFETVSQSHIPVLVMMAVRLSVGGHVAEYRAAMCGVGGHEFLREIPAVIKQACERDFLRQYPVIEEEVYLAA